MGPLWFVPTVLGSDGTIGFIVAGALLLPAGGAWLMWILRLDDLVEGVNLLVWAMGIPAAPAMGAMVLFGISSAVT